MTFFCYSIRFVLKLKEGINKYPPKKHNPMVVGSITVRDYFFYPPGYWEERNTGGKPVGGNDNLGLGQRFTSKLDDSKQRERNHNETLQAKYLCVRTTKT